MNLAVIISAILVVILVIWQTIQLQAIRRRVDAIPADENTVALLQRLNQQAGMNATDIGSLQARLDSGYAGFEDAGLLLLVTGVFQIQVIKLLAIDQSDPDLFGLRRVDEHSFHCLILAIRHVGGEARRTGSAGGSNEGEGRRVCVATL